MEATEVRTTWVGFVFSILLFIVLVVVLALLPAARADPASPFSTDAPCAGRSAPDTAAPLQWRGSGVGRERLQFLFCNPGEETATDGLVTIRDLETDRSFRKSLEALPPGAYVNVAFTVPDEYATWEIRFGATDGDGEAHEDVRYHRIVRAGCSGWSTTGAPTLAEVEARPVKDAERPWVCVAEAPALPATVAWAAGVATVVWTRRCRS